MEKELRDIVRSLFEIDCEIELSNPDAQFGDVATNVAMQLAGKVRSNPRAIAEQIVEKLSENEDIVEASIAGPGFINIRLSDGALLREVYARPQKPYEGKVVVAEYSDPNPFKVLHAGHLYTTLVGDVMTRLLAVAGADVKRVNFGGDVGRHVAMNMWAIVKHLGGELPENLKAVGDDPHEQAAWLSARYVEGNEAFENDETAKKEITDLNQQIYQLHSDDDHNSPFAQIYWACREWSYSYFKVFYDELDVLPFDKYYPESQTAPIGIATVERELESGVYERSDGAVIFNGEKHGLHTRVFMNSNNLPTYEAKEVGLIMKKWQDYQFDESVIITGNDITEYMKVVQKSIEQFDPELTKRSRHMTHGNVKLAGGKKMSSRKGTVLLAMDILKAASEAQAAVSGSEDRKVMLGAVKYAFLKTKVGGDIVYSPEESVSLQGNSGPYLQYAHARARQILKKSTHEFVMPTELFAEDRQLIRKLGQYHAVVDNAVNELAPHLICTYLFELAQEFNRYYEKNRVIGDQKESHRVCLVALYADILQAGLTLLGIDAPSEM